MPITPEVRIVFKDKDVAAVSLAAGSLPAQINVANPRVVVENTSKGFKGFQLSEKRNSPVSTLLGDYVAYPATGYQGIITQELSDANGGCNITISFSLSGAAPENLYIQFDAAAKEYAVNLTLTNNVNSKTITITNNTDTLLILNLATLKLPDVCNNLALTLNITKWSRANASIKITRLSTYWLAVYTGNSLKSFSCSENLFDSQMQLQPGICEQYADIVVYDRDNVLHDFALTEKLTADYPVNICASDDEGTEYDLGSYIVSDFNISATSSQVTIACRDRAYLFEKIDIARVAIADRTLEDFINILFAQAKNMPYRYQDSETLGRCQNIKVPNSWYLASDLYTMLTKVCALGMLRIYWYIDTFVIGRCA